MLTDGGHNQQQLNEPLSQSQNLQQAFSVMHHQRTPGSLHAFPWPWKKCCRVQSVS